VAKQPTGDETAERETDRWQNEHGENPRQKQNERPILDGPSETVTRKTKIKGVRVVYDVGGGSDVAVRDHPTAERWEVTKHGQLVLRDSRKRQVARYRQFVWREVIAGEVRE
jgi:hypothetical protein